MGVTHVLNAAHGTAYSQGGHDFYGASIDYYGVRAYDRPDFDISQFFFSASEFIHKALNTPGGMKLLLCLCCKGSRMPHSSARSEPCGAGGRGSYETPALADLQRLVWLRGGSENHVDQVWPNVYLGDAWAARNKTALQNLNITHILNAADGPYSINTGAKYYNDLQIEYYGIEAFDDPSFDLSIFFYDAANFIGKALNTSGGKVFVHCAMGVSRSASLVLAFLMIHENMTLVDALKTVSSHRDICPNSGFLSQLRDLDIKLNEERKGPRESASRAS
ncbi:DS13B phosphatase, partial [Nothoprocta ornata]|nr:DS13B phosphatase [Nothoprocta pentlandii]NWX96135.1 DS13B phosphatase [Nothoprocta ornata]